MGKIFADKRLINFHEISNYAKIGKCESFENITLTEKVHNRVALNKIKNKKKLSHVIFSSLFFFYLIKLKSESFSEIILIA
jgi:hypothetical protein